MRPVVAFLTDFGTRDHYAGMMKGVVLSICPEAALVDITHDIAPQDIRQAVLVLEDTTPRFPPGSIHVAVIDPGPTLDSHRDALAAALSGERVRAILVTHCHGDHSPLAAWLKDETGAPTFGFGPHGELPDPEDQDGEMKPASC